MAELLAINVMLNVMTCVGIYSFTNISLYHLGVQKYLLDVSK